MTMRFGFSRSVLSGIGAILLAGSFGCESSSNMDDDMMGQAPGLLRLRTLSNRADLVSGGDALIEILLPPNVTGDGLRVTVASAGALGMTTDVSNAFTTLESGRIIGRVTGLVEGANKVVADLGGKRGVSLFVTNHDIGGPVFSGPHVTPFICATPLATPGDATTPRTNASGLSGTAVGSGCNIASEAKLYYRTRLASGNGQNGTCANVRPDAAPAGLETCFKPYSAAVPAADVAMTTTDAGVTMPYIVRVDRGTVNRGIYDIAVLFDPKADDAAAGWKATAPQPGWNRKVLYLFGASTGQPRLQFRSSQNWNDDNALSRGFMVVDNSMTDSALNSNRTSMSETIMMMKEKIIDEYGEIRFTMGAGCSGGSINQLTAASIYPGLLDGIQPTCTYPDSETTAVEVSDCTLLVNAYQSAPWKALQDGVAQADINVKKAAINGHVDQTGCHAWVNLFSNVGRPGVFTPIIVLNQNDGTLGSPPGAQPINNCQLPNSMVYHPTANPGGVRCSGADHAVGIFGKVPGTNRARTTGDNVGVQYGLKAFLSGAITGEEFVTLNEVVGGFDADFNVTTTRTVADADALATAYRAGIVSDARQLAKTAMIDMRGWDDAGPNAIHHVWRSFALRARVDKVSANAHKNHVMWRYGTGLIPPGSMIQESFLTMDRWLTAIKANTVDATIEAKVANSRPAEAFDFCYLTSDTTFSTKVTDPAMCDTDARLKPHTSPRQVAGGPVDENILKCQLKPLAVADYAMAPTPLTDAQLDRLRAVFPGGVCDFSKPGVGQQPAVSPLDFSAGPGGRPFPPAPETRGP
jgi:hypothetical protein